VTGAVSANLFIQNLLWREGRVWTGKACERIESCPGWYSKITGIDIRQCLSDWNTINAATVTNQFRCNVVCLRDLLLMSQVLHILYSRISVLNQLFVSVGASAYFEASPSQKEEVSYGSFVSLLLLTSKKSFLGVFSEIADKSRSLECLSVPSIFQTLLQTYNIIFENTLGISRLFKKITMSVKNDILKDDVKKWKIWC